MVCAFCEEHQKSRRVRISYCLLSIAMIGSFQNSLFHPNTLGLWKPTLDCAIHYKQIDFTISGEVGWWHLITWHMLAIGIYTCKWECAGSLNGDQVPNDSCAKSLPICCLHSSANRKGKWMILCCCHLCDTNLGRTAQVRFVIAQHSVWRCKRALCFGPNGSGGGEELIPAHGVKSDQLHHHKNLLSSSSRATVAFV